ncbi:LCK-like protein [Mya arenaria]|uniref:Tyrosine-protein kinase n=1 Tax=Mya arenaria TaxID=6604 RepID=A0ABY7G0Q9_MYAAR|nr:LCK-like protein [Mya arenaria]
MEKKSDKKMNKDKKQPKSVSRSISMRFTNFRNRGKAVDKCGRVNEQVLSIGRPVGSCKTQSVSMGAMNHAQYRADMGIPRGIVNLCQRCSERARDGQGVGHCSGSAEVRVSERRCRGKSADRSHCYQCSIERQQRSYCDFDEIFTSGHTSNHSNIRNNNNMMSLSFPSSRSLHSGLMLSQDSTPVSPHEAPSCPPPALPTPTKGCVMIGSNCLQGQGHSSNRDDSLSRSWDRIYASRQGKICLEPYRRPKALPCLHSFCEHCLSDYVRRNSGSRSGYFACPMCRKEVKIPPGGIQDFQDNFILLSLSDTLHEDDSGEIWQKDGYPLSPPRSLAPPTPLEPHHNHPAPSTKPHHNHSAPSTKPHHDHSVPSTKPHHDHSAPSTKPHHNHSAPSTKPHHDHSAPSTKPHHNHSDPQQSPTMKPHHNHSAPSTKPHHDHSAPSTKPHHDHSAPLTNPHHNHSAPSTNPHHDHSAPSTKPHHDHSAPSTKPHHDHSAPSTKPHHNHSAPSTKPHHDHSDPQQSPTITTLPPQQSPTMTTLPLQQSPTMTTLPPQQSPTITTLPLQQSPTMTNNPSLEEWLLSSGYPKGSFLVRQGEASPDTLTLSVRDCDELRGYLVKHYKILTRRQNRTEYFFITPKRMFDSMSEMVEHYLESADGLCCRLSQVCSKPRSLSWAQDRGKEDDYSTHRDTVTLVRRLGSGQFADVWEVKIQRQDTVKMAAFLDEAQILKTLDHPNILKLLAVCCVKEPVYLVTEYLENGRLSLYLREGKGSELKLSQLLWICAQVADALSYMEKEKFIHRNLGARNVLVGEKKQGLKMAIKWMAPEVLLYNKYGSRADVWSFGILMTEVLTYGKEPYEGMGGKEAFEQVQQGYRMPQPDGCPLEVYDVIRSCWSTNPPSRPTFDFLNTFLHDQHKPS